MPEKKENKPSRDNYATLKLVIRMLVISLVIMTGLIFFYGRDRLFSNPSPGVTATATPAATASPVASAAASPSAGPGDIAKATEDILYKEEVLVGDKKTERYLLRFLVLRNGARSLNVRPVLSNDAFAGTETLSSMNNRVKPYAMITGGFFGTQGEPLGMYQSQGRILSMPIKGQPALVFNDGKAALAEMNDFTLRVLVGDQRSGVDAVNPQELPANAKVVVYTPEFGDDNRAKKSNLSLVVKNNKVAEVARTPGKTAIPKNGFVMTFFDESVLQNPAVGTDASLIFSPNYGPNASVYQCGNWILQDRKYVAKTNDSLVGLTTSRDSRAAVGITTWGDLVFAVADGGSDKGVTGVELGRALLAKGVTDAAFLDTGAAVELIMENKTITSLSSGAEKAVGGGLAIFRSEEKKN